MMTLITTPALSSTVTVIDTGPSSQNGGLNLNSTQWIAGYFGVTSGYRLLQVSTNYWGNGGQLTFAFYEDASLLPGSELASFNINTAIADTSKLNTLTFSLPSLLVSAGEYWAAFEVRAGQTFDGGLQGGWGGAFQNSLDEDAVRFGQNGSWKVGGFSSGGRLGLTIEASPVPIPPAIALFVSGLITLVGSRIVRQ